MRLPLILPWLLICAIGCGAPGAPLPPSLGIPKPVGDLKAVRKADTVTLKWSSPTETTDGELIRKTGKMAVLRSLSGGNVPADWKTISQLALPPALKDAAPASQEQNDAVGPLLDSGADFAAYSVLAQSGSGRGAGASNQAAVALVPTPATPARVSAVAEPSGISLSWDQPWTPQNHSQLIVQYSYRIMRREEGSKNAVVVKEVSIGNQAMALIDTGMEWQKHYEYWIVPVTTWRGSGKKGEVEGQDSQMVQVFANDVFPPAVPTALEAVFSGIAGQPSIDLSWTPDMEPDLAGYNVYRHEDNQSAVKINSDLVKSSSFQDQQVRPGTKYYYSVSAVDLRGNESGRSTEAAETVPPQ